LTNTHTIAVTGASRGIGAAIALELARRGFTVGCLTRKGTGPETGEVASSDAQRLVNCRCDVTAVFSACREVFPHLAKRIPLGRPGTTTEVARLVAAIFSENIPFLTGETIYLDGGQGIAH